MLAKYKVINPEFKNHDFRQAIDMTYITSVYDNGDILDIVMESGEKIKIIREGFDYDSFVGRVNHAKALKALRRD